MTDHRRSTTPDTLDAPTSHTNGRSVIPHPTPALEVVSNDDPLVHPDVVFDALARLEASGERMEVVLAAGFAPMECARRFKRHADAGLPGACLDLIDFVEAELTHYERTVFAEDERPHQSLRRPRAALAVARGLVEDPSNDALAHALDLLTDSPETLPMEAAQHVAGIILAGRCTPINPGLLEEMIETDVADLVRCLACWHDDIDGGTIRDRAKAVAARFRAALGGAR